MATKSLPLDIATLVGLKPDEETQHEDAYAPTGKGTSDLGAQSGNASPLDRRSFAPRSTNAPEAIPEAPVARSVEDILAERGKTHGDFTDNARVMQSLKRIVHDEVGWNKLTDVQREALHMILHKVGRIISGNPNVHDHWDDIAGYAKLASERITP